MGISEDGLEEALMHLFELGLVDVQYDENLEAMFKISEEGLRILGKEGPDV